MKIAEYRGSIGLVLGLLAFSGGRAEASLIGDIVTVETLDTGSGSTDPLSTDLVTVVDGVSEIVCPGPFDFCSSYVTLDGDEVDIEASRIRLDLAAGPFPDSAFIGYRFSSLDWTDAATILGGFILSTDIDGLTDMDVSFGNHELSLNFAAATVPDGGGFALVELVPVGVPEPFTLGLLFIGFASAARLRRRHA